MIIEVVRDSKKRYCSVCRKRIKKGSIIVKYEYVIDSFRNVRMWFAHVNCLINKLKSKEEEIEKQLKSIPKIFCEIKRYERG